MCMSMAWSPPTTAGEHPQDTTQPLATRGTGSLETLPGGAFERVCFVVFQLLCRDLGPLELPQEPPL